MKTARTNRTVNVSSSLGEPRNMTRRVRQWRQRPEGLFEPSQRRLY